MPSFATEGDPAELVAELRQNLGAGLELARILTDAPGLVVVDEFAPPTFRVVDIVALGGQPTGMSVLLACGGLRLGWEEDEPTYEVGSVAGARSVLELIDRSIEPGDGCIHLLVPPDVAELSRSVIEAAIGHRLDPIDAVPDRARVSTLPGIEGLDEQQRAAVLAPADRDILINAGAGSGKTHTLAYRIAHLVTECGIRADRCIVLTFSRGARDQIEGRLSLLAANGYPQLGGVEVQTLHAFCRRLLMLAAGHGLTRLRRGFRIVDEVDERTDHGSLIRAPAPFVNDYETIFAGVDDGLSRLERLTLYPLAITALRNGHPELGLLSEPSEIPTDRPVTVASPRTGQFEELSPVHLANVWARYAASMASRNEIDLGGLMPEAHAALRDHERLLRLVSGAYDILFVDEYQDTTQAQDDLLLLLARTGIRLNVVGDGDQTINSFAGAYSENITGFLERIERVVSRRALLLPLETNYRSRPEIVALASNVIARNRARLGKTMRAADSSQMEEGHVLRVDGELRYVASWIGAKVKAMIDAGIPPSSIAVLYRREGARSPQMSVVRDHLTSVEVPVVVADDEADGVRLLTIHRAKGQEFEHVFVLYLRRGDFPDLRGSLEEERRLLYVAVTRARARVYLCGHGAGDPDLFEETNVAALMPSTTIVRTLAGVLAGAALDELHDIYDDTDIDDWDEPT